MLNACLVESVTGRCHSWRGSSKGLGVVAQFNSRVARIVGMMALAVVTAGCVTKPKPTSGVIPQVEVGPPLKADAWKQVATAADEDRIARLGLAWQEALADARKGYAEEIRKEGVLLKPRSGLPRPAPTPGSYYCRLIKLGK